MKKFFLSLLLAFSSQGALVAQDYYVPIKKELEPMARLPLESFHMDDASLQYRLPLDITGRAIDVQLTRDTSMEGPVRLYKGPLATATCMGTDGLPACVVQHRDLKIDKGELLAFAQKKYQDPRLLAQMSAVQQVFSTPNEPIGIIAKRALIKTQQDLQLWNSRMIMADGSSREDVRVQLDGATGLFRFMPQTARGSDERVGELSQVMSHGAYISGRWRFSNQTGWFQWRLNSERTQFEGSWGLIDRQGQRTVAGSWNGTVP